MFHLFPGYGHSLLSESVHAFCLSPVRSPWCSHGILSKCKSDPVSCPRTVFPSSPFLVNSSLSFRFQELNHYFLGKLTLVFLTWLDTYMTCLYIPWTSSSEVLIRLQQVSNHFTAFAFVFHHPSSSHYSAQPSVEAHKYLPNGKWSGEVNDIGNLHSHPGTIKISPSDRHTYKLTKVKGQ